MVAIEDHGKHPIPLGQAVPDFSGLRATDGKRYGLADFEHKQGLVLIFTSNHCPYAQAYEERLIALAQEFMPQGIGFLAVNSNHAEDYPEDSFENMVIRAARFNYPYPYAQDEDQSLALAYRAICTPHVFVIRQGELVYRGRIDDSWMRPEQVTRQELREALQAIVAGQPVAVAETHPMGCSIRWRFQEAGNPDRAIARDILAQRDANPVAFDRGPGMQVIQGPDTHPRKAG